MLLIILMSHSIEPFMTPESIIIHLERELKNGNTDAFIMLDLLIRIQDWYDGMTVLMSYKPIFKWFDGHFHVMCGKGDHYIASDPSVKARSLNVQLCNFIIANNYFQSSLVIDEQMLHKWSKGDVKTEFFAEQCLHNVQHDDSKIIAKSLLLQNENMRIQTKVIKMICIVVLAQFFLSLIMFTNATEICTQYDNYTMCTDDGYEPIVFINESCYSYDNMTICVEDIPCEFCNNNFDPITVTLDYNNTFDINM